jgi:hypothetical protein
MESPLEQKLMLILKLGRQSGTTAVWKNFAAREGKIVP